MNIELEVSIQLDAAYSDTFHMYIFEKIHFNPLESAFAMHKMWIK